VRNHFQNDLKSVGYGIHSLSSAHSLQTTTLRNCQVLHNQRKRLSLDLRNKFPVLQHYWEPTNNHKDAAVK